MKDPVEPAVEGREDPALQELAGLLLGVKGRWDESGRGPGAPEVACK